MAILGYKNSRQLIRKLGLAGWLETRGLAGWLEIATDGLEAPARERIAIEIGAHYAEAVGAHLAAGESELSAQAAALAELGDPQEAALNFQKSHLTEFEARSMRWMERTAAKPLFSFRTLALDSIPLAALLLLVFFVPRNTNFLLPFEFILGLKFRFSLTLVLVAYAGCRVIPRLLYARTKSPNSFWRQLALSFLITDVALALGFAQYVYISNSGVLAGWNSAFILFLCGYRLNPGLLIWNKLRKMGEERNELPPGPTTAS
jgi:hypothetical protein